ncbi:MAG: NapC/NirT family cytochrome c [Magnetococcales bacterium]|nr:NapC/NirT family cytochrome c [Magnetococcales bacterium]
MSHKQPHNRRAMADNRGATLPLAVLGGLVLGGMVFFLFHFLVMDGPTNTLEFCISCHEMEGVYKEYSESIHYKNHSGVRVVCADCHVPHGKGLVDYLEKLEDKVLVGGRHLYHHLIGTYPDSASFERERYRLAQYVLGKMKERDSRECRRCHTFEAMQLADQSRSAANKHGRLMKQGDGTCIDCHSGVVHEEPKKPGEEQPK